MRSAVNVKVVRISNKRWQTAVVTMTLIRVATDNNNTAKQRNTTQHNTQHLDNFFLAWGEQFAN